MEYRKAHEAEKIANDTVIPQWHPDLRNAAIAYVDVDRITRLGNPVLAKVNKASGLVAHLANVSLVLTINREAWDILTDSQKVALVDHELEHVRLDDETSSYVLVPHDVEEFSSIIERHGLWYDGVRKFIQTAGQLNLFGAAEDMNAEPSDAPAVEPAMATNVIPDEAPAMALA